MTTRVPAVVLTFIALINAILSEQVPIKHRQLSSLSFNTHLVASNVLIARSTFAADMDGDGDVDLLSTSNGDHLVSWYENDGSQSFTRHNFGDSGSFPGSNTKPQSVVAADFDGDGDMDAAACYLNSNVSWFENDGAQNFTGHIIVATGNPRNIFAIDLDQDGDIDILVASQNGETVDWLENSGSGSFTLRSIATSIGLSYAVKAADLDGDGDIDVISQGISVDKVYWFENDGNQGFTEHLISSINPDRPIYVHAGDFDGDGDIDVVSSNIGTNDILWYENTGGSFNPSATPHTVDSDFNNCWSVDVGDMDNDGDLDIVGASQGSPHGVFYYENDGTGSFTEHSVDSGAGITATFVYIEDIDGDGDNDLAVSWSGDDTIKWYENLLPSPPTISPSAEPSELPSSVPSALPTNQPTSKPSDTPTTQPTSKPTSKPSDTPTTQPTSEPVKCMNSYRVITALCTDYPAEDIINYVADTDNCLVKIDEAWTCVPVENLSCRND